MTILLLLTPRAEDTTSDTPASAGGGGPFTIFREPQFDNEKLYDPFNNPFRPKTVKR